MFAEQELLALSASEQISLIKSGKLSARELGDIQQFAFEKLNPAINAVTQYANDKFVDDEQKPLAGISIGVKENIDVAGFNTTAGLEYLRDNQAISDSFCVSRLRASGATLNAKLNMHEGALGASNHNSHYGNCYNPWQLDLTPGGSSGGSAAAVAAGLCSIALGTDTMGSVRIPASYCGVFGFKPSRGAVSNRGSVPCATSLDNIGPLARSAEDLLLAFNLMQGFDNKAADSRNIQFKSSPQDTMPVLLVPESLENLGVEDGVLSDFNRNIDVFVDMGCTIRHVDISDYDFSAVRRHGLILCEAEMRCTHQQAWEQTPELFSPYLTSLLGFIDSKTPMDVIKAEQTTNNAIPYTRMLFNQGDYLLMPTTPQRAFAMNESVPVNQADFTSLANHAGLPAVSLPMLTDSLPCGMQLIGKQDHDYELLNLAIQWQQQSGFKYYLPSSITEMLSSR
ncbi:amidase [Thalassotalea mangrovi]|uniref:Amidase n=1 Tax=Thalassotalea mangrovi TaxID=2572245 RepID=A0A4U1B1K4_9GAMM|nr:amidase [Thalassotalea mangrovi]TKB43276.1 amidase [Thalassotalea mangrovi]